MRRDVAAMHLIYSAQHYVGETVTHEPDEDGELVPRLKGKARAREGHWGTAAYHLLRAAYELRGAPEEVTSL